MKRILIALGVLLMLAGCWDDDERTNEAMSWKLRNLDSVSLSPDGQTLSIVFEEQDTLELVEASEAVPLTDTLLWVEAANADGAPIAYSAEERDVLPATIAFAVQRRTPTAEEKPEEIAISIFAPPRPAQLHVQKDVDDAPRLVKLIEQAINEKSGAAFAVRDSFWIEDVILIEPSEAMRLHGMVPKQ